jgi:hypothetical protein
VVVASRHRLVVWAIWLLLVASAFFVLVWPALFAIRSVYAPAAASILVLLAAVLPRPWMRPAPNSGPLALARLVLTAAFAVVAVVGTVFVRPLVGGEVLWVNIIFAAAFGAALGYAVGDRFVPSILRRMQRTRER